MVAPMMIIRSSHNANLWCHPDQLVMTQPRCRWSICHWPLLTSAKNHLRSGNLQLEARQLCTLQFLVEAPQLVRALQGVGQCALVDLRSLVQRKPVVALRSCPAYCGAVVARSRGSDSRRTVSWRRRLLRTVTASSQRATKQQPLSCEKSTHCINQAHSWQEHDQHANMACMGTLGKGTKEHSSPRLLLFLMFFHFFGWMKSILEAKDLINTVGCCIRFSFTFDLRYSVIASQKLTCVAWSDHPCKVHPDDVSFFAQVTAGQWLFSRQLLHFINPFFLLTPLALDITAASPACQ